MARSGRAQRPSSKRVEERFGSDMAGAEVSASPLRREGERRSREALGDLPERSCCLSSGVA